MALLNCNSFRGRGLWRSTVFRWPTLALRYLYRCVSFLPRTPPVHAGAALA